MTTDCLHLQGSWAVVYDLRGVPERPAGLVFPLGGDHLGPGLPGGLRLRRHGSLQLLGHPEEQAETRDGPIAFGTEKFNSENFWTGISLKGFVDIYLTSFTSTLSTLTPQGSVATSRVDCAECLR